MNLKENSMNDTNRESNSITNLMDLDWLVDLRGDMMHRLVDLLLDDLLLFDDGRLVVNVHWLHQGMNVLLLLHFNWNMNDDLSMSVSTAN